MNGMSLVISNPCYPMYNFCTLHKSTKIDLIPRRLSNLHFQGITPSVATTPMLKRCPYLLSALKDGKGGLSFEVPEVGGVLVPSILLGVAIIGIALAKPCIAFAKPWEVVEQSISTVGGIRGILKSFAGYQIFPLAAAVTAVAVFLGEILFGYAVVPYSKPFSVGEIIQFGSVKGRVTKIGLIATSLLGVENAPIIVPNSFIFSQGLLATSPASCCDMVSKIFVQVDEIEKIDEISAEIINMMKSKSNVYFKKQQPYCYLSDVKEGNCAEVTLGCHLKEMCEDELLLAKHDVLVQASQIIKKHGATLAKPKKEGKAVLSIAIAHQ